MENVLNRIKVPSLILLIIAGLFLLLRNCEIFDGPKEKSLEEISVPIAVQFLNATGMNALIQPENVAVEIDDPAGQLLTAARNPLPTTMVLPNGLMSLGLKQGAAYSPDTPYIFTVHAVANGFLENTLTITISSAVPKYEPVFMVDENTPPFGINFSSNVLAFGNNGVVTNALSVQATVGNKGEDPIDSTLTATLIINEGTQLLNKDCTAPIQSEPGEAKVKLFNFNPRTRPAANAFPGGAVVYNAVDTSGESLADPSNPFVFASYGYLNIEMSVGEEEVGGFEGAMPEVSMEVASDFINPETGNPVQPNDVLPMWSLNSQTGQWTKEADIAIAEVEGKLVANFKVPHLSFWNLDSPLGKCANPVVINLNNAGNPFRVRYIDLEDNTGVVVTPVRNTAGNVFHLPAGATTSFDIINTPPASDFDIRVHQTFQENSGVVLNHTFSTCATEPDAIPVVDVPMPNGTGDCRELVFRLVCPGGTDCLFLPSSVGLWVGVNSGTAMFAGFFSGIGTIDFDMTSITDGDDLTFTIWFDADADAALDTDEEISFTTTGDFSDISSPVTNIIPTSGTGGNCDDRVTFEIDVPLCLGTNFEGFIVSDSDCDPST